MTAPDLEPLLELIRRLRGPEGCPWDQKQRLSDLRAYLIEEAHETAAAIDVAALGHDGALDDLREELGDLLFQVCFVAEVAASQAPFDLQHVIDDVCSKMIARHPHVFGKERLDTAEDVARAWEQRKLTQRGQGSLLDGLPASLPALTTAFRMGQKAAAVGFDWQRSDHVLNKVDEELAELRSALDSGERAHAEEELGDLLLTLASLARHRGIDPERALAHANRKFARRFQGVEADLEKAAAEGTTLDADQLEDVWRSVKASEAAD